MNTKIQNAAVIVMSAVLGFICVVAPPYLVDGAISRHYNAPLFPFVRTAVENMSFLYSATSLLCLGVLAGTIQIEKMSTVWRAWVYA